MNTSLYITDLHKVGMKDIDQVGGKNASLGEMLQNPASWASRYLAVFVVTVAAYREFIRYNNLDEQIRRSSTTLNSMTLNPPPGGLQGQAIAERMPSFPANSATPSLKNIMN